MTSAPVHRSIIAIDIENFAAPPRTDAIRIELRKEMYSMLEAAMSVAGIHAGYCDPFTDRGDGILVLVHPVHDAPMTSLLYPLVPALTRLLVDHNRSLPERERTHRQLRLRVVVHAGEVHFDGNGYFGDALDLAFRLLDSPRLKDRLRHEPGPLAVAVSDLIYWSIVSQDYEGIERDTYQPVLRVTVAGRRRTGWVHVPDPVAIQQTADGTPPFTYPPATQLYREIENHVAQTCEPYDVDKGIRRLARWANRHTRLAASGD